MRSQTSLRPDFDFFRREGGRAWGDGAMLVMPVVPAPKAPRGRAAPPPAHSNLGNSIVDRACWAYLCPVTGTRPLRQSRAGRDTATNTAYTIHGHPPYVPQEPRSK